MKLTVTFVTQVLFAIAAPVVAGVVVGTHGVWGAVLGVVLVVAFFGSTKFLLGPIVTMSPAMSQAMALLFFLTKAGVLAALLIVLRGSEQATAAIDFMSLALTIIGGSVLWISTQTIDHARSRVLTYDLPETEK